MRNLRGTYVRRGDAVRKRARIQRLLLVLGLVASTGALAWSRRPVDAAAQTADEYRLMTNQQLQAQLQSTKGRLDVAQAQLERWNQIFNYSSQFKVGANLAQAIYDAAIAEGIEPELGFRLVRVESEFNEHATSPVGAIGLTQVMLPTAKDFDPQITKERLYDPTTNLRIGFRYLHGLIREYHGNVNLALLVYNRGPAAVENALSLGIDPGNGYDRVVLRGYHGKGTTN